MIYQADLCQAFINRSKTLPVKTNLLRRKQISSTRLQRNQNWKQAHELPFGTSGISIIFTLRTAKVFTYTSPCFHLIIITMIRCWQVISNIQTGWANSVFNWACALKIQAIVDQTARLKKILQIQMD